MGGYIMQLQNFSVNDGEGIRTIVFLAGCPLRCAWCANPEGQTARNCMTRWAETEEIVREIRRQSIFYRFSGGGVTFSGGEPTAQPQFLRELTDVLYDAGLNLAIETCGHFDFELVLPILRKMDLIFMDLKHMDPALHSTFTGVDNELILANLRRTAALGIPMVARVPAIVGFNGSDEDMSAAFAFLRENAPNVSVELLPYHRLGEDKYHRLGLPLPAGLETPTSAELARWYTLARSCGLRTVSYK